MAQCSINTCADDPMVDCQFCNNHRCLGMTAKGNRCKSSRNCGIVHARYMETVALVGDPEVKHTLTCNTCRTVYEFTREQFAVQAPKFVQNRGVCKNCRS